MKLDRYVAGEVGRRRLSGRTRKRGAAMGMSTLVAVVFGGLFVAVGGVIMLVGMKVIPVDPSTVHVPFPILACVGLCFFAPGWVVWGMAWRQFLSKRRRAELWRQDAASIALADYPWQREGFTPPRWTRIIKDIGMGVLLTLFLSAFNYWAFYDQGPLMVKVIVSLFDVACVFFWGYAVVQVGRVLKFSETHITFERFPYPLAGPIIIRWQPPRGLSRINQGTFTLRCVEEWYETSGSGDNRSTHIVHEELWQGTWFIDEAGPWTGTGMVDLRFDAPASAPPTALSGSRPIFWELEVKLDLPGLDFTETYLVPVYA